MNVFSIFLVVVCGLSLSSLQAGMRTYTLDATQSVVSVSGTVAGFAMSAQGPGSLSTTYQGTITADKTNADIQFLNSSIIADNSGIWSPGLGGVTGTAPANYGIEASGTVTDPTSGQPVNVLADVAVRNLELSIASPLLPITAGAITSSQLVVSAVSGDTDVEASGTVVIFIPITVFQTNTTESVSGLSGTNMSVNASSISVTNGIETLTIDLNNSFTFSVNATNDSMLTLSGQWVATRVLPPCPVITDIIVGTTTNQIDAAVVAGESYQLEQSTNLNSGVWNPSGSVTSATNSLLRIPVGNASPYDFFRLELIDP